MEGKRGMMVVLALILYAINPPLLVGAIGWDTFNRSDNETLGTMSDETHSWYEYEYPGAHEVYIANNAAHLFYISNSDMQKNSPGISVDTYAAADGRVTVTNTYLSRYDGTVTYRASSVADAARRQTTAYHIRLNADWSGANDIILLYGSTQLAAADPGPVKPDIVTLDILFVGNHHVIKVNNAIAIDFTETTSGRTGAGHIGLNGYWNNSIWENFSINVPTPGDVNLDGTVDVQDFGTLAANYGVTSGANWSKGDFNLDGAVNYADLASLVAALDDRYRFEPISAAAEVAWDFFNRDNSETVGAMADGLHDWYEYEFPGSHEVFINAQLLHINYQSGAEQEKFLPGLSINNFTAADGRIVATNVWMDRRVCSVNYRAASVADASHVRSDAYHVVLKSDWSGSADIALYYGNIESTNPLVTADMGPARPDNVTLEIAFVGNRHVIRVNGNAAIEYTETVVGRTGAGYIGLGGYWNNSTWNRFSLSVPIPGDANLDGKVDAEDLKILAANYGLTSGATHAMGDFNGDGAINGKDREIFCAAFYPFHPFAPVTELIPRVCDTFDRNNAETLGTMSDGTHGWYEYEYPGAHEVFLDSNRALLCYISDSDPRKNSPGLAADDFTLASGRILVTNSYISRNSCTLTYRAASASDAARRGSTAYHVQLMSDWSGSTDIALYYGSLDSTQPIASADVGTTKPETVVVEITFLGNHHVIKVNGAPVIDFTETTAGRDGAGYVGLSGFWNNCFWNDVTISGPAPGDANLDGKVDVVTDDAGATPDMETLLVNYGKSSGALWSEGDFNQDGAVNDQDIDLIIDTFTAFRTMKPLTHKGEAFFPIGAYGTPTNLSLSDLHNAGWNVYLTSYFETDDNATLALLNDADQSGMAVILYAQPWAINCQMGTLAQKVSAFRNSSGLLGYYIFDEPENYFTRVGTTGYDEYQQFLAGRTPTLELLQAFLLQRLGWVRPQINSADEYVGHYVFMCTAWESDYSVLQPLCDVNMPNKYPTNNTQTEFEGTQYEIPYDAKLAAVGAYLAGRTGFSYGPLGVDNVQGMESYRPPTLPEFRYSAFAPITQGAMGMIYWAGYRCSQPYADQVIFPVTQQLSSLKDFFLGQCLNEKLVCKWQNAGDTAILLEPYGLPVISGCLRQASDGRYLALAVNNTAQPVDARFYLKLDEMPAICEEAISGQIISIQNNSISFEMGPYGVVAFVIDSGSYGMIQVGDANLDGRCSFEDFTILQNHYNQTGSSWDDGDFNGDGTVNFADFVILQNNYNRSTRPISKPAGVEQFISFPCQVLGAALLVTVCLSCVCQLQ